MRTVIAIALAFAVLLPSLALASSKHKLDRRTTTCVSKTSLTGTVHTTREVMSEDHREFFFELCRDVAGTRAGACPAASGRPRGG
jgi:hypothetical protein